MMPFERPRIHVALPQLVALSTLAAAFAVLGGCTGTEFRVGDGTGPEETVGVALDAQVPGATAPSASAGRAPSLDLAVGDGTLVVDRVRFAIEGPQAGRAGEQCGFDADGRSEDVDACVDFAFGLIVTEVPVDQPDTTLVGPARARAGSFDRFTFRFDPLNSTDPEEIGPAENNPILEDASVAVEFTYDGERDTLTLAPTDTIRAEFTELLTLDEGQVGRVLWVTDVASWFRREDGSLIDPRDAPSALRDTILANVLESFSAQTSVQ